MKRFAFLVWRYMQRCRQLKQELSTARRVNIAISKLRKETSDELEQAQQDIKNEQAEVRRLTEELEVARIVNEQLAAAIDADIERERLRAVAHATKRSQFTIEPKELY